MVSFDYSRVLCVLEIGTDLNFKAVIGQLLVALGQVDRRELCALLQGVGQAVVDQRLNVIWSAVVQILFSGQVNLLIVANCVVNAV